MHFPTTNIIATAIYATASLLVLASILASLQFSDPRFALGVAFQLDVSISELKKLTSRLILLLSVFVCWVSELASTRVLPFLI